jgi:hypothetical protein
VTCGSKRIQMVVALTKPDLDGVRLFFCLFAGRCNPRKPRPFTVWQFKRDRFVATHASLPAVRSHYGLILRGGFRLTWLQCFRTTPRRACSRQDGGSSQVLHQSTTHPHVPPAFAWQHRWRLVRPLSPLHPSPARQYFSAFALSSVPPLDAASCHRAGQDWCSAIAVL